MSALGLRQIFHLYTEVVHGTLQVAVQWTIHAKEGMTDLMMQITNVVVTVPR